MAEAGKDTIYIDVDDEITSIIDKITSSKHKIVALVLPKRASMLQSIVNMKLLKRSGDLNKKKIVLITSESSLLPLAGAVKLHVAKTLQSKPDIPAAPKVPSSDIELGDAGVVSLESELPDDIADEIESDTVSDEILDKEKTVGELATAKKVNSKTKFPAAPKEEVIELDNDADDDLGDENALVEGTSKAGAKGKGKAGADKAKKSKIPNFSKFRKKIIIGSFALVLLLVGFVLSVFVLPSAKVIVKTDDISVNVNTLFTVDTAAQSINLDESIVPASEQQVQKTDTEKITATGKKNVGERATGTVSVLLDDCDEPSVTVPAGTTFTSNGLNFISEQDITLDSVTVRRVCSNRAPDSTATVRVIASEPGDQYNLNGGRKFEIQGFSNVSGTDSSSMKGGTNKEITVVSQQDVDSAKQRLADKSKNVAQAELKRQLEDTSMYPLVETFTNDEPAISSSPAVDEESPDATVTSIITYKMLGVKRDHIKEIVTKNAKTQIDENNQSIQSDGLDKAIFRVTNRQAPGNQTLSVQTVVSTGTEVDKEALSKELAGKKKGEIQQIVGSRPGVKEVDVEYSPFWVYKTPNNPKKITIEFQATGNASD